MRSRKSAEVRRGEIVAAALTLIDRGGPSAVTTTAIAEAIGISQAAVFRHFPKKDEILLGVVDWIGGQLMPRVLAAAGRSGNPLERLQAVIDTVLRIVTDTPAMPALLFSRELHNENAILRTAVYGRIVHVHDLLTRILRDGVDRGYFCAKIDVDRAAFMIIGLFQGLLVRWSLSGRCLNLEEEGQAMFVMLLDGFLARRER
ncbi:TetR/AcrR family transcriptional regulator [Telmatospirillum sp.]|uniref:TetR/AcrR family transcriptional regulator n=1 Tax=Telmatospirillum sp. TaxID=2079197 RepID=UPI00283DA96C|nr:TetR/AcrR family transcriptional regulator [Telmatospirillum sp.]MDR3435613.1 TetR/AcrR family transcriptional regulator [Telmatospirillum sp.]